jgi:hypothetical protein
MRQLCARMRHQCNHEPGLQGYEPGGQYCRGPGIHRKLLHGAYLVLQWCAANAVVTRDPAGRREFDKTKSTGRIDALVALAMALSLALLRAEKQIVAPEISVGCVGECRKSSPEASRTTVIRVEKRNFGHRQPKRITGPSTIHSLPQHASAC